MINLIQFINVPLFLASLIVGVVIVYFTLPDQRKIYIYPTPDNIDVLQYRDKTNTCFEFKQTEVKCPSNNSFISKVSAQT